MIKTFSFGLIATLFMLSTQIAQAQGTLADQVFSAVEKSIILNHYGVKAPTTKTEDRGAPDWAMRDDNYDRNRRDGERDDNQSEDQDRKDKHKDKNKHKDKGLPPGLAKRDHLPPGLAKQLKEKGRLPPGIAKRNLPADLAAQLPARPGDQEVTVINNDVVLIDRATGIILDILKGVIPNDANGRPQVYGRMTPPPPQNAADQENLLDTVLKSIFGGSN
jgi:hypothetical protein